MNRCDLVEAKVSQNFFTWNNKQQGNNRVFSRLDKVLVNDWWLQKHSTTKVYFKNEGYFDHCPRLVSVYPAVAAGRKPFKYCKMWQSAPQYRHIVSQAWQE